MMTDLEINRTIHEGMGECWHEDSEGLWGENPYGTGCKRCGTDQTEYPYDTPVLVNPNPSYTTSWADYGQALEWAQREIWWDTFKIWLCGADMNLTKMWWNTNAEMWWNTSNRLLSPLSGSTALAEFIQAHPEYFKEGEKE